MRYREAVRNSWDKNDPKDAQVIREMLRPGAYRQHLDSQLAGHHDLLELAKTYYQVSRARTKVQHSRINHCLPLYSLKCTAAGAPRVTNGSWAFCWSSRRLHTFAAPACRGDQRNKALSVRCDTFVSNQASSPTSSTPQHQSTPLHPAA